MSRSENNNMIYNEQDFLNKWGNKKINFFDYRKDLEAVYKHENPVYFLEHKTSLPWFSYPLPDVDMKEIQKECFEIFRNSEYESTHILGHDPDGWRIYHLYKSESGGRDKFRHNGLEYDKYSFVYDKKYPALKDCIEKYNSIDASAWISANPPGSKIPIHFDKGNPNKQLTKKRLSVFYPEDCFLIMEEGGIVDFYHQELVCFNHKKLHGVWNNSQEWKIDLSIVGFPQNDVLRSKVNNTIKNKIEQLLDNNVS